MTNRTDSSNINPEDMLSEKKIFTGQIIFTVILVIVLYIIATFIH